MGIQRRSILCADGQRDICALFSSILNDFGFEVITSLTFSAALSQAVTSHFDILIIGSEMPDGTTIELFKQIRGKGILAPIILTSASHYVKEILAIPAAGSVYFLNLPFQLIELKELLFTLL
jgi:DNA-binding NtrC family response regulator